MSREPKTPEEWRSRAAWARRKADEAGTAHDKRKFSQIAEIADLMAMPQEAQDQ